MKPVLLVNRAPNMTSLRQMKMRITTDDQKFPGMKKFKVHGKELKSLPRSLFSMLDLEVLDLSPERETCLFFQLTSIPKEIGQLALLKVLILDTNQLKSLPEEIGYLKGLERLALSNNLLRSLPSNFCKLRALKSLHCSNNQFRDLPEEILNLPDLVFLDFSNNYLMELPAAISNMSNLQTLLLNYNQLQELPESFCQLQRLETLWLSSNNISSLPANFGKLSRLDWTRWCTSSALDGNPLRNPPMHVAKQGPKAIGQYFKSKQGKNVVER
ncbi:malignant fibrous histiocytoma-amplified sequence 1 homolog isoform X1 [Watersipora subatra]|uniref:malignant fibrous histiocytoma-amplified sequence 1 homolog isoform X1 n=2 Tax=Watersipora subatra TaxID=2589382 RepID=UPI00355C3FC2